MTLRAAETKLFWLRNPKFSTVAEALGQSDRSAEPMSASVAGW